MKILCISGINNLENPYQSLHEIVEEYRPEIIICLGGLVQETELMDKKTANLNIFDQLLIFGLPILFIPSKIDLKYKKKISHLRNSNNFNLRWIYHKLILIETWNFIGFAEFSEIDQSINKYYLNEKSVCCVADSMTARNLDDLSQRDSHKIPHLIIAKQPENGVTDLNSTNSLLISIPSIKENKVFLINIATKMSKTLRIN